MCISYETVLFNVFFILKKRGYDPLSFAEHIREKYS